jgi:squalene synthase HpnC
MRTSSFLDHLARHGPDSTEPAPSLPAARRYCERLATTHYENFSVVSPLLPRRLHRPFHAVYAWCRWADDLADEVGQGRGLELLRWWRRELDAMYAGQPRHPVTVALQEVVTQFAIPPEPFHKLLFAFEQDQLVSQYAHFEQLRAYCRGSADPVGRLVLYLARCHMDENARLSDDICTGLQLANFWQDVARDLAIGRVYIPEEDRVRFGVADADLFARHYTPQFARLMQFEVDRTRSLFLAGRPLVDRMPKDMRLAIDLFVRGGLAVLRKIERVRYNVLEVRPALSSWDKGSLLAGAVGRSLWQSCA